MSTFFNPYNPKNLVKDKTCFKDANTPGSIDVFLTNNSLAFQNSTTTFTGLSDCYKLMLTFLKTFFSKNKPKELFYQHYQKINFSNFDDDSKTIFLRNNIGSCYHFNQIFLNFLDKHAPLKRKLIRANHSSCISKPLCKSIMKMSYLEKGFLQKQIGKKLQTIKETKKIWQQTL